MGLRIAILTFAAAIIAGAAAAEAPALTPRPPQRLASSDGPVDLIRVDKSERRMELVRGGEVVRTYRVALGRNPEGHKRRSGDGRTPVGRYVIDWRNPNSEFHLSLRISYPNMNDVANAARLGANPGGLIMIHGDLSSRDRLGLLDTEGDWTDGCIAVTDAEMDEIWALTPTGVAVEITE